MAISRDQKEAQVKALTEKMSSASSVMLAHYIGMSVAEVSELRSKLKEGEAEMKVAKKTLIKLAAKEAGLPDIPEDVLDGPVSLIFSYGDALSGAQVAFKFGKDHDQVELIGGVFDGQVLTKDQAVELAKMPSREALLAMFVGMLRGPLNQFAGMCSSPLSGFARAVSEMAEKGGFGDEPEPEPEAPAEEAKADEPAKEETSDEKAEDEAPASAEATADKPKEEAAADKPEEKAEAADDTEAADKPAEEPAAEEESAEKEPETEDKPKDEEEPSS